MDSCPDLFDPRAQPFPPLFVGTEAPGGPAGGFGPPAFPLFGRRLGRPRQPPRAAEGGASAHGGSEKRAGARRSPHSSGAKRTKPGEGDGGGGELRRRRRAELKEQLEEAGEKLRALQEKVLRAFGESHLDQEENGRGREDDEDPEPQRPSADNPPFSPIYGFRRGEDARRETAPTGRGGVAEGVGLWLDWDEDDHDDRDFARALKAELGGAVARVIDRVLCLYGPDAHEGAGQRAGEDDDEEEDPGGVEERHEEAARGRTTNGSPPPGVRCAVLPSPDLHKAGPPPPGHPDLPLRPPGPPLLLAPAPRSKEPPLETPPSPFPAPPLTLPLLQYSMQQLFSRSLQHPQMAHPPPPSRKDFLHPEAFLEFPSHSSFPPLPFVGHLGPSLLRHAHGQAGRERDRGVRGAALMDVGELYLNAGGAQEGLSPCHLKKAKLLFFYARYPSSNTLKTYFPDVKFNRCVTSQMIKWFSNFREFFYIQMERFARQAVREALDRDGAPRLGRESQLRLGRDTELYRILNMHYNKSNIYQVPERFIEVSEVALREFHLAIWTGRDSDPCWKKGIYKIICKLDSAVPDSFRLPGCPVG
ncbi:prospero homeobox 3 [Stigmatopora argus]